MTITENTVETFEPQPGILYWGKPEGSDEWKLVDFSNPDNIKEYDAPVGGYPSLTDLPDCER